MHPPINFEDIPGGEHRASVVYPIRNDRTGDVQRIAVTVDGYTDLRAAAMVTAKFGMEISMLGMLGAPLPPHMGAMARLAHKETGAIQDITFAIDGYTDNDPAAYVVALFTQEMTLAVAVEEAGVPAPLAAEFAEVVRATALGGEIPFPPGFSWADERGHHVKFDSIDDELRAILDSNNQQ